MKIFQLTWRFWSIKEARTRSAVLVVFGFVRGTCRTPLTCGRLLWMRYSICWLSLVTLHLMLRTEFTSVVYSNCIRRCAVRHFTLSSFNIYLDILYETLTNIASDELPCLPSIYIYIYLDILYETLTNIASDELPCLPSIYIYIYLDILYETLTNIASDELPCLPSIYIYIYLSRYTLRDVD